MADLSDNPFDLIKYYNLINKYNYDAILEVDLLKIPKL